MTNGNRIISRAPGIFAIALLLVCGCKSSGAGPAEGAATTEAAAAGKPVIAALEAEFDFGTVKQGAEVAHTFKIKNTGDKNLVIEKTTGS